ncbi:MAG: hypothetical protein HY22_13300 [[Candidatus Thermochlorobacteriaceae] bacterium GBChlB]|jgi:hypothetical protein|nr:MAG: hypothetical protein HY22_13300 [[Candidatus Thermochlorobacteriaceae] bacterium GBChlB]
MEKQGKKKTTIYKTDNGCVLSDAGCTVIQLEFGNLFLRFDLKGLESFKECIDALDLERYEIANEQKPYHRKIFVALQPTGVTMAFHREEVMELRKLVSSAKAILMLKKLSHEAVNYPKN